MLLGQSRGNLRRLKIFRCHRAALLSADMRLGMAQKLYQWGTNPQVRLMSLE